MRDFCSGLSRFGIKKGRTFRVKRVRKEHCRITKVRQEYSWTYYSKGMKPQHLYAENLRSIKFCCQTTKHEMFRENNLNYA
jgi:hypothetical protein